MKIRNFLLAMVFILYFNEISGAASDSGFFRKKGLHLMISVSTVMFQAVRHNPANLFYSNILAEPQFNFKRHCFGIGFNKKRELTAISVVNGLPKVEEHLKYSLFPSYSYLSLFSRRWQIFTGLGFVYNYDDTVYTIESNIEIISRKSTRIEKGCSFFGRINYMFNKRISLVLELSLSLTRLRSTVEEHYPLTPSMSFMNRGSFTNKGIYFIPSNMFIRFSL